MNVEEYLKEVLVDVTDTNQTYGSALEVEEIEIVPDDAPTVGQVRHCAAKLAEHTNNSEQNGCRQRLEGYLSCQQRFALAVA